MTDSGTKNSELLQITKNTQENSIIEQRLGHKSHGEGVRKYMKGKLLGKGGFARCFQATNTDTNKLYAIKIVNKQNLKKAKAKQKLITEIKIHKTLKHRRVVQFDHVFEDSENVYILLELCTNHTLNELLKKRKRLGELQAQYFLYQLVQGLLYIHQQKIIHRDLKLGNLMLSDNMELKIGDFGLAAKIQSHGQRKKTICGTPNYIAPQILEGKGHSYQVDVWSIGAILYALVFGRPPFETSDVKKTYKRIKQCQYTFPSQLQASTNLKNLISRMLVVDPSKRITLQQIKNHAFLTQTKIPTTLPSSIFSGPLPNSFLEDYQGKFVKTSQNSRILNNISDRLLLRSSSGFNRNYFTKTSSQKNNPRITPNNFFTNQQPLESNKKAHDIIIQSNIDTTFVKKWVDYSSKYGLGYLLSDKSTGIYFNDASKIILNYSCEQIDYISSSGQLSTYTLNNLPSDRQFNKKITLMQYFKKYLNGQHLSTELKKKSSSFCYVKRWVKSQQGILFRLSNKIIQANFNDKSQLVIYAQKNVGVFSSANHSSQKIFFELGGPQMKHPKLLNKMTQIGNMIRVMKNSRDSRAHVNDHYETGEFEQN